jgi:signal transduction histidine kinase
MTQLSRHVLEMLWEDGDFVLSRSTLTNDATPMLVLAPAAERAAPGIIARLEHAYALREELEPSSVARPLSQSEARRNRVALRMEPASDLPMVMGDRIQLQQMVMNLILNGIEAMSTVQDRDRELVIRTARDEGDEVRVAVRDTGIGFHPLGAERIFDAFYKTKPGGLGMGLAISRSIVEWHGGRLRAKSNGGPGATFQFTLRNAC